MQNGKYFALLKMLTSSWTVSQKKDDNLSSFDNWENLVSTTSWFSKPHVSIVYRLHIYSFYFDCQKILYIESKQYSRFIVLWISQ